MNLHQHRSARPKPRDGWERLFQRLEEFQERERQAGQAKWVLREAEKLTRARLALFGCIPE